MTKQGTILIVDDNKGVLAAIDMLLSGTFKKVITISNPNRAAMKRWMGSPIS